MPRFFVRAVRFSPRPRRARHPAGALALGFACAITLGALRQTDNVDTVLRAITAPRLRAHVSFLADDLLEGRAPGTRGGRIAARYIAIHLQRAGLQPPVGGWYQPVPLLGWRPDAARTALEFVVRGRRIPVRYPDQAVLWTVGGAAHAEIAAPLVFAGFGVVAPEYDWDDYGAVDVAGKVVLILAGDPPATPDDPEVFDGFALSVHGRWDRKLEEAARRGAAGALLIHSDSGAGYAWNVVRSSWTGEQFHRTPGENAPAPPEAVDGWIRPEAARFVLAAAGIDMDSLELRAGRRDFAPVPTDIAVRARATGVTRRLETANVIGIVPGSDSALRDEAVVYTAHYDHLGIGTAEDGDSIYNGAYDNASGVAVLLELATGFASLRPAPRRTIVFVATAAEEAGLLGSMRYVLDPVIPIDRTAAVLNLDGANLWGETSDIAAVGVERSTLGATAELHARRLGLRLAPERAADRGLFFRSDHFPFARAGVPALYLEHGLDYRDRPPGWGATTLSRYESERYHRPGDHFDSAFDLGGAVQQARFALLIGLDVANTAERPRYTDGSEFQRARERPAPRGARRLPDRPPD